MITKKPFHLFIFFTLLLGGLLLISHPTYYLLPTTYSVHAATLDLGINQVDQNIALASADPRVVIARIIRTGLSLLGIIAVLLILYGGFMWMTANGEEEKIKTAKGFLVNAVVGLAIVLASWSIATFVLNRLVEATTGSVSSSQGGGGDGGGGLGDAGSGFRVREVRPRDPTPLPAGFTGFCRNTPIRLFLTQNADPTSVPANVTIHRTGMTDAVPTQSDVSDTLITLHAQTPCPGLPNERCFDAGSTYHLSIPSDFPNLRSAAAPFNTVNCTTGLGLPSACEIDLTIKDCIDIEAPQVAIEVPTPNQSVAPGWFTVRGHASDDQAIGGVEFFNGNASGGWASLSPVGALTPVDASFEWQTSAFADRAGDTPGSRSCQTVGFHAVDADSHETSSLDVPLVVRPAHCFNNRQDAGETGFDCGGVATSIEYCGKCAGAACAATDVCTNACRSGACVSGRCKDVPRIDRFDPISASKGSFVTIEGEFFGNQPGTVTFLGGDGPQDDTVASRAPCTTSWSPTRIIVTVPSAEGFANGPLEVKTAAGESDRTDDNRGFVGNFMVGGPITPGLCAVSPGSGRVGDTVTLAGTGFGDAQGTNYFEFRRRDTNARIAGSAISAWTGTTITGKVSPMNPGVTDVRVAVDGTLSNTVPFEVVPAETGTVPVVSRVTPADGPPGTYVTISGSNFGTRTGVVEFELGGKTAIGASNFPESCNVGLWQDDSIVVKVPERYATPDEVVGMGIHSVRVRRASDNAVSVAAKFTIRTGTPGPGLCRIDPISGPRATPITFFGEQFGTAMDTFGNFYNNVISPTTSGATSSSLQFTTAVPATAITGPVHVQVGSGATAIRSDNELNFKVQDCRETGNACPTGTQCCTNGACSAACVSTVSRGGYAWTFGTGPIPQTPRLLFECSANSIPSPAPLGDRAQGTDACNNSIITGRFSTLLDTTTVTGSQFQFRSCTVAANGDVTCTTDVSFVPVAPGAPYWMSWADVAPGTRSGHGFQLKPTTTLASNTWYEVKVKTGIRGDVGVTGGGPLDADTNCGNGFAYCWRFKTRANTALCDIGSLDVSPATWTIDRQGGTADYRVSCRAQSDVCAMISCSGNFSWDSSRPSQAGVTQQNAVTGRAQAFSETVPGPAAVITARVQDKRASGELIIDFPEPYVMSQWPNCTAACTNAGLGVLFNVRMYPLSLQPNSATLSVCANETCDTFTGQIALRKTFTAYTPPEGGSPLDANRDRVLNLEPVNASNQSISLAPNTFYRVVISGRMVSEAGAPLTRLNYNANRDYSWMFRTKADGAACGVSSIDVVPQNAQASQIGERISYAAVPRGSRDACNPLGQELIASSYNWTWASVDPYVANFVGGAQRNASANLPLGCSSACLLTGSAGRVDHDAVCGDGVVEPTKGEECDDRNVTNGDGCSSICLHEGRPAVSGAVAQNLLNQPNDFPTLDNYISGLGDPFPQSISPNPDAVSGVVSARIHSGSIRNGGGTYGGGAVAVPLASQIAGRTYTLSYLAKAISTGATTIIFSHQNGDGVQSPLTHTITPTGEWMRYSLTAVLNTPKTGLFFWTNEPDRTFLVDDFRLVEVPAGTSGGLTSVRPTIGPSCGNNIPDIAEECDDGNTVNGDGCSNICLNEGSAMGGSVCGNGSVGRGEDCDDGSVGCSSICLHTGSHPAPFSLCGNNVREVGEACDDGNLTSGDGCSDRCLLEGTPPCRSGGPAICCGNGDAVQAGEACDDHNINNSDGCSSRCLLEGSSFTYPTASFCGDGVLGTGEACEAAATPGNGVGHNTQVIQAIGQGEVVNGAQSSVISAGTRTAATTPLVSGTGNFTLQCGFRNDNECPNPDDDGVGTNSCCYARPRSFTSIPTDGAVGICRNPLLTITFAERMDITSFTGNVLLARASATTCATGETPLSFLGHPERSEGSPAHADLFAFARDSSAEPQNDNMAWWQRLQTWFDHYLPFAAATEAQPNPPTSGAWCVGSVSVTVRAVQNATNPPTTTVTVTPEAELAANIWYRVRLRGDDPTVEGVSGIRAANGVGYRGGNADGSGDFAFHTGPQACDLKSVEVHDDDADPSVFGAPNSFHHFTATALTEMPDGTMASIASIPNVYAWTWQAWTNSDNTNTIVRIFNTDTPNGTEQAAADGEVFVKDSTVNGTATISASAQISVDTIHSITTVGRAATGAVDTTVFVCENPWPAGPTLTSPLSDAAGNTFNLPAPFGNFSTRYCRDAGAPGPTHQDDDLPALITQPIPPQSVGVLKEFELKYPDTSSTHDVIGFRMVENQLHVSAARWYALQGFTGSPQATTVDDYDAVRDGNTVYINAANIDTTGQKIYTNIYIIGYNANAAPETVAIFNQLLENMRFNINSPALANQGVCINGSGDEVDNDPATSGTQARACTANLNCPASTVCRSAKAKVRRDTHRLEDLRSIEVALNKYKERTGHFPTLSGGTFIPGQSSSAWPSWIEALSRDVGVALPSDPLNKFTDCAGFDAGTCFSAAPIGTVCPSGNCAVCPAGSHVYHYQSQGTDGYGLNTDLEYQSGLSSAPYPEVWQLSLADQSTFLSSPTNSAVTLGVHFAPDFSCRYTAGSVFVTGTSTVCGDGIVGTNEACETGYRTSVSCSSVGISGVGMIAVQCNSSCQKRCSISHGQCTSNADCSGGALDVCTEFVPQTGAQCATSFCGDGVTQSPNATGAREECDDGANNGRYGFCGVNCTRAASVFCGDGRLAGTEQCDCGLPGATGALPTRCSARNGEYGTIAATTCTFDCKTPGAYCGDLVIQTARGEQCDGNSIVKKSLCSDIRIPHVCDTDSDCFGGQTCVTRIDATVGRCPDTFRCSSSSGLSASCVTVGRACDGNGDGINEGVCTRYPQERIQRCNTTCGWRFSTTEVRCQVVGSCGNGFVDGSEECDDGNQNTNDACTNACRQNICGDGIPWVGVEACDFGAATPARAPAIGDGKNGDPCVAAYGGTCNYCSNACIYVTQTGAFCGDGIFTPVRETCDRTAPTVTCPKVCSGDALHICTVNAGCAGTQTCVASTSQCLNIDPVTSNVTPLSRCSLNCNSFCPDTVESQVVRFKINTEAPSSSHAFGHDETQILTVPACRISSGLTADISFGPGVLHFPSPMAVLFVLDNSASMTIPMNANETRITAVQRALCGAGQPNCNSLTNDGAIAQLFASRPSGNVKIGIIDFGGTSRFRTSNQAADTSTNEVREGNGSDNNVQVCELGDPVPCYDASMYPAAPDAGTNGFLVDNSSNRNKLRAIVGSLDGQNSGTKTYLAFRQAKAILDGTDAASKIIILMSDGESVDCCAYQTSVISRYNCHQNLTEIRDTSTPRDEAKDYCVAVGSVCQASPTSSMRVDGNPDCRYSNPEATAVTDGHITVFTVAFPEVVPTLQTWATPTPAGTPADGFHYWYGSSNIGSMLQTIIDALGVTIEVSGTGITTRTTTVEQDSLGVPLKFTATDNTGRNYCTDGGREVTVTVHFTALGTGDGAKVHLDNMQLSFCPLTQF